MAEQEAFEGLDTAVTGADVDEEAAAMAAIAAAESGTTVDTTSTTTAPAGNTGDTPAAAAPGSDGKDGVTVEPSGVLAADGKNIIPYDVLKNTREQAASETQARQQAEDTARQAQEQLAAANVELEQLRKGKVADDTSAADADAAAGERIAALQAKADAVRDELPAMAEFWDSVIAELKDARIESAQLRKTIEDREAGDKDARERVQRDEQAKAAQTVQQAIDSNPTLAFWQAGKDEAAFTAYNTACDFDEKLRTNPEWKDKPMGERFAKAVELTQLTLPSAPKLAVTPSAAEIAARAAKAVKEAGEFEPSSLSDLPGGAIPGADALENLAGVDIIALGNRVEKMSQAQIDELLNRL